MKAFIIAFSTLFALALSVPAPPIFQEAEDGMDIKSFPVEKSPGVYEVEDLENSEIDTTSSPSDVSYYFFSRDNSDVALKIASPSDDYLLKGASSSGTFNNQKDTVIFIHGWMDSNVSDFSITLRNAALKSYDINVFVVDWSAISKKNYISARYAVVKIGETVGEFIQSLVDNLGLDLDKLTIAGHSLGAHVAGIAGQVLEGKVAHIVGLDPALPLYNNFYTGDRLDPTDAKYVQVIHTSAGFLGFKMSIGHADYYPNGGASQKGCILDIVKACAHVRSWELYAGSLANQTFTAKSCSSYLNYNLGFCKDNGVAQMGGLHPDYSAQGDYYLQTNSKSPYALE